MQREIVYRPNAIRSDSPVYRCRHFSFHVEQYSFKIYLILIESLLIGRSGSPSLFLFHLSFLAYFESIRSECGLRVCVRLLGLYILRCRHIVKQDN